MEPVVVVLIAFAVFALYMAYRRYMAEQGGDTLKVELSLRKEYASFHYPDCNSLSLEGIPAEFDRTITVDSERELDKAYQVNLKRLSCTCLEHLKRKSDYPEGDIRRVCKHIRTGLIQEGLEPQLHPIVRMALEHGRKDKCYFLHQAPEGEFAFAFEPGRPWVRIYYASDSTTMTGSYNLEEDRWAYNEPPANEYLLKKAAVDIFVNGNIE